MSVATFYPTYPTYICFNHSVVHYYDTALAYIHRGANVRTTQMCLLNEVKDYDEIRIVNGPDDVVRIVNNHDGTYGCDRTDREIRFANNLLKMWENGVFDR